MIDITAIPTVQKVITQASMDIFNMTGLNVKLSVQVLGEDNDSESYGKLVRLRSIVSDYFRMPFERISSKTRKPAVIEARHVYMFIAFSVLQISHRALADEFGQDRTAAIHAVSKIAGFIKVNDPAAASAIKVLELFTNSIGKK